MVFQLVMASAILPALVGCGGAKTTTFTHPEYNFDYVERVAVVPFENLTNDQGAAARATRYFLNELLTAEAFDVVEPGEVAKALEAFGLVRTGDLTREQVVGLGQTLNAQAIFLGSIAGSEVVRAGSSTANYVTMSVRLVETDTGITVWSTTNTTGGRGLWSTLFGTPDDSMSEVTRECVASCVSALVK